MHEAVRVVAQVQIISVFRRHDESELPLFAGDLVFLRHVPVVDGSLTGWLSLLPALTRLPAKIGIFSPPFTCHVPLECDGVTPMSP